MFPELKGKDLKIRIGIGKTELFGVAIVAAQFELQNTSDVYFNYDITLQVECVTGLTSDAVTAQLATSLNPRRCRIPMGLRPGCA